MTTRVTDSEKIKQLTEEAEILRSESLWSKGFRRLRRDRLTMIAIATILLFGLLSLLAPVITNALDVNPNSTDAFNNFLPVCNPFAEQYTTNARGIQVENAAWLSCQRGNYLGTDNLGRDHLARLLYGGRISLAIGFTSAIVTVFIGLSFGMIVGYFGGLVDDIMNWVITTLNSIPSLYLLIAISAIFSPSPAALVFIFAVTGWTGDTRLVRGQTLQIRDLEYVVAARALGASPARIMRVHVFPNIISVLVVSLAITVGAIILAESALSFLSLGVQPPTATWGNMLTDAQDFFQSGAFHLALFPGLLISITFLCMYIIGDGIRDAFDPTTVD
jgi:ABC-type dipeptide/oligopeptide/nickel transport system permease subunit